MWKPFEVPTHFSLIYLRKYIVVHDEPKHIAEMSNKNALLTHYGDFCNAGFSVYDRHLKNTACHSTRCGKLSQVFVSSLRLILTLRFLHRRRLE